MTRRRGSFCAYVDVRALLAGPGARLKFYDTAGVILPAIARGLDVRLMGQDGQLLAGGRLKHDTPVALVVARPEVLGRVLDAVVASVPAAPRGVPAASAPEDIRRPPMLQ